MTPSGGGSSNGGQAVIVKLNSSGSILKTKFHGGQCEDDLFRSVIESSDNKLIMVGEKVMETSLFHVPLILGITKTYI